MSQIRVAIIYDDTARPETTGVYCRRALGELADVEHFLPTEMDRLLLAVQTAPTDDAKRDAIGDVQRYANETVPYVLWGPAAVLTAWEPTVHGVKSTVTDIMLFDDAWKSAG